MIIRGYGKLPPTYAPDIGEVVLAHRSHAAKWLRAVVLFVRRRKDGALRVKVHWLEGDPAPASSEPERSPIAAGDVGWVIHHPPHAAMIKRLPAGSAPASAAPVLDGTGDDLVDGDG